MWEGILTKITFELHFEKQIFSPRANGFLFTFLRTKVLNIVSIVQL